MEIAPYKKEINKIKRKERQSVDSLRTERFFEEGEHRTDPQTKKPRSKIVQSHRITVDYYVERKRASPLGTPEAPRGILPSIQQHHGRL